MWPAWVDRRLVGQKPLFAQETRERDGTETGGRLAEKIAAIQKTQGMAGNVVFHGMNRNSLLLSNTRQSVAKPWALAEAMAALTSKGLGWRPKASW